MRKQYLTVGVLFLGMVVASWQWSGITGAEDKPKVDEAALERAREKVKIMDDLHKGYVVTITSTYVEAKENAPAASVAKKVFAHMEKQGWGKTRLIDGTGKPVKADNAPKTDFEKSAMKAIKEGKPYVDEVAVVDGKPVLRAATVVPVVMKQCIICHPGNKEGDVLGAFVYEVPIR